MKSTEITREEMWAKQHLSANEIDYAIWEQDKVVLQQMSKISRSCSFVVDVYKYRYAFASSNFADILGYDSRKIATLEKQGDYLESRFHPDDLARLEQLQINLSKFIYSLPHEQRNDYCNIYSFRLMNAKQQYIRVISRQQVLEQSLNGNIEIAPNQTETDQVECTVLNLKNGEMFSPTLVSIPRIHLTQRELEILQLIQKGLLSKEIAHNLCISIHTVNIHRQNLLHKLGVQNSIEAINAGLKSGILS